MRIRAFEQKGNPVDLPEPPSLSDNSSAYIESINRWKLSPEERLVLLLSMIEILDPTVMSGSFHMMMGSVTPVECASLNTHKHAMLHESNQNY